MKARRSCSRGPWFAVAVAFFAGAPAAWAQSRERTTSSYVEQGEDPDDGREFRFSLGAFGGYHFFADKHPLGRAEGDPVDMSPKDVASFGGWLGFNFNRWVSLEAEASAHPTITNGEDGTTGMGTNLFVAGFRGSMVLHFSPRPWFRPFLLMGAGAVMSISNNEEFVPGDADGILHAGFGFKVGFGDRAGLRIDGRVLAPPSFASKVLKVGKETGYEGPDFQVFGGLFINFSHVQKFVREVHIEKEIVKEKAPPPPPPPKVEPVVVVAPPPNPDPDGDGIVGAADKCPDIAEDKDGFQDDDGCPEADNDQDGIPDALDKCPNQPETFNGVDDADGCPEIDSDGDGFIGSLDKCPAQPETVNGYQDADGCPDEVPQAIKKFTGVIEGIKFKTNSADILPGSYVVLDNAVSVLKDYPDIKIEISGHTDSRGNDEFNRALSQRRAESVRNYFILKGVDSSRLTAIGYGEERPIADNSSASGRAQNRRTEFRLLQ